MEDILKIPAFQQVPGLIIMGFIVIAFLKYLSARDQNHARMDESRDKMYLDMHRDHLEARNNQSRALEQSSQASRENAEATRANTRAIGDLSATINGTTKHH